MSGWDDSLPYIAEQITGSRGIEYHVRSLGGGCINQAIELILQGQKYFVKLNRADNLAMFASEAAGLQTLAEARAIRTPRVICHGAATGHAYLVLEYIPLENHGDPVLAGHKLAALHRTVHEQFGWKQDNYIGTTPQPNHRGADWVDFWRDQRLGHQLALAAKHGYRGALSKHGERLLEKLPGLLGHNPAPSLLHGDLWSGNLGYDCNSQPVIYDPAVYFGDREADLAMTELFGGFPSRFYDAYNDVWPLDSGYKTRKILYNLYHILNHLNLFGGHYEQQALDMTDRLLAALEG